MWHVPWHRGPLHSLDGRLRRTVEREPREYQIIEPLPVGASQASSTC